MKTEKGSALVLLVFVLALAVAAMAVLVYQGQMSKSQQTGDRGGEAKPKVISDAEKREALLNDTTWTEANIRARPDLYLSECRIALAKSMSQCEDSIFALRTKFNLNEAEAKRAENQTKPMLDFLRAARDCLKDVAAKYPAKVGVYYYESAEALEKAFWATDAKIRSCKAMVIEKLRSNEDIKSAIAKLEAESKEIGKTIESIPDMIAQLKNNTFSGDMEKIAAGLSEAKARMKTIDEMILSIGGNIGRVEQESPKKTIDEVCAEWGF